MRQDVSSPGQTSAAHADPQQQVRVQVHRMQQGIQAQRQTEGAHPANPCTRPRGENRSYVLEIDWNLVILIELFSPGKQAAKIERLKMSPQTKKTEKRPHPTYQNYPYKCHLCKIGFKRRGMLVNHLSKRHPDVHYYNVPELTKPIVKVGSRVCSVATEKLICLKFVDGQRLLLQLLRKDLQVEFEAKGAYSEESPR